MERSQRSPFSKIMILTLLAALFLFIVCRSAWHSRKLYAHLNQALNEYVDELDLLINQYEDELSLLINEDSEESGLQINENIEQFSMSIDGDEDHGGEFESTYNFGTHSTILIGQSETLALENPNRMEAITSEGKKAKEWVSDLFLAEDSKHLGELSSRTSIKSLGSPLLYAITSAFFCAAAVVINWYRKRALYASRKTSLEFVKENQAKTNNRAQQPPFTQLSKMQTSSVPSVLLINEYSQTEAVSSSSKKNDSMWNDSSIPGNSFYISNLEIRRKGDSASTTNQGNIITEEIHMENSSYGSLTSMAKKDKDKKQQKVIPPRRPDQIGNPTKSNSSLYKQDVDKKQQKGIPLRRSERIRNSTKSDCAHR